MASHSRTRIRVLGGLALLLLTLGLGACGSDDASDGDADAEKPADSTEQTTGDSAEPTADAATITAADFAFAPATLEVDAGTEVTIQNEDGAPHTFTADDGSFDEPLTAGKPATHTFDKPGSFAYHCEIHSSMKGTVEVG